VVNVCMTAGKGVGMRGKETRVSGERSCHGVAGANSRVVSLVAPDNCPGYAQKTTLS
jgi:hypothetical protein